MFVAIYKTNRPKQFELSSMRKSLENIHRDNTWRADKLVRIVEAPKERRR